VEKGVIGMVEGVVAVEERQCGTVGVRVGRQPAYVTQVPLTSEQFLFAAGVRQAASNRFSSGESRRRQGSGRSGRHGHQR